MEKDENSEFDHLILNSGERQVVKNEKEKELKHPKAVENTKNNHIVLLQMFRRSSTENVCQSNISEVWTPFRF